MTKTLTTLLAVGLLTITGCGEATTSTGQKSETEVPSAAAKVDSPERLAADYEQAFKAQDADAVRSLYCWEGVEGELLQMQKELAVMEFEAGLKEIVVDEVPPSLEKLLSGIERNGKLICPNIEVTKVLRVTYSNNSSVGRIPIGKKDGKWMISSSVEKEIAE